MTAEGAILAAAVLLAEAACLIAIARRVSSYLSEDDLLLRAVVGLVVGIGSAVAILQLCGMVDLLRRGPVLVAHVLAAFVVLAVVPKRTVVTHRAFPSPITLAVAAAGVFVGGLGLVLGVTGSPSTEPDTVEYHAPNAGFWLQSHNLWHLPVALPGYFTNIYPSNGELAGLWLMLPSHSDQIAYAVNVVFGLLAVLSAALIVRELGGPSWSGALAGLAVVAVPVSFQTQTHSLMTDLAAASGIVAAVGLVLVSVRSTTPARWAVLAGVALGLGVGSKDTAVLPAVGALVLIACLTPRAVRLRRTLQVAAGVVTLAGFWWVRATVATGNPIFPAGLSIGGHQLLKRGESPLNVLSTTLFDHVLAGRFAPLHRWEGFARTLIGPALLVVAVGLTVPFVVGVARRRRPVLLVSGLAAACLLAYLLTPYTGGGPQGLGFLIASQLRYALPGLLLAAVAAAAVAPRVAAVLAGGALLWDVAKDVRPAGFRTDIHPTVGNVAVAVTAVALLLVGVATARATRRPVVTGRRVAAAGAALAMVGLVPAYARTQVRSPIQSRLAGAGRVMVVSQTDLRSLMGTDFATRVVSPVDPAHPATSPRLDARALQKALVRLHPGAVVVPANPGAGVTANWAPPGYTSIGKINGSTVYVSPTPTPPTTIPAPPPPPTTIPAPPPTTIPAPPATTVPPGPPVSKP